MTGINGIPIWVIIIERACPCRGAPAPCPCKYAILKHAIGTTLWDDIIRADQRHITERTYHWESASPKLITMASL
jgi:hypothetical protein